MTLPEVPFLSCKGTGSLARIQSTDLSFCLRLRGHRLPPDARVPRQHHPNPPFASEHLASLRSSGCATHLPLQSCCVSLSPSPCLATLASVASSPGLPHAVPTCPECPPLSAQTTPGPLAPRRYNFPRAPGPGQPVPLGILQAACSRGHFCVDLSQSITCCA